MNILHRTTSELNSGVERSAWMRCAFVQGMPSILALNSKYDGGWTS